MKGARALYATKKSEITKYDQDELIRMLQDNSYHSPEMSETDEDNPSNKRLICVYDYSWRSKEVCIVYLSFLVIYVDIDLLY